MIYNGQLINSIIFDLGGVILNIDYQMPVKAFKKLGIDDFSAHFSQKAQSRLLDDYETGKISSEEFLDVLRNLVKPDTSDLEIIQAWNSILLDLPEQRLFTLEKAAENHRIFLLSNTNDLHIEEFNEYLLDEHNIPSLEPFFEALYLSYEIGLRKPDPRIFEYVLQDADLDPQTTLFIDDSIQHIASASELGLITHHLQNEDLTDFLEELL
ncbi:MAG: HAD family phosphatase [Bacteroidia bacterium]